MIIDNAFYTAKSKCFDQKTDEYLVQAYTNKIRIIIKSHSPINKDELRMKKSWGFTPPTTSIKQSSLEVINNA